MGLVKNLPVGRVLVVNLYWIILGAVIPVFSFIGLGLILRRLGWLLPSADQGLLRMVIYLFYPALILYYTLGNPALKEAGNVIVAALLGFGTVVLGFGVAWWIGRSIGLTVGKGARSFAFSNGVFNYGYIPVPLIAVLFVSRETTGVLFVFNVGVELAMWTIGIVLLSGGGLSQIWSKLLNPPIVALTLGLAFNFVGLGDKLPTFALQTLGMMSACAVPLGLILSGATLFDLLREGALRGKARVAWAGVGLRLLILPAIMLALAKFIPGLSQDLQRVLVVQSAMPAAMFSIVMARHYGG